MQQKIFFFSLKLTSRAKVKYHKNSSISPKKNKHTCARTQTYKHIIHTDIYIHISKHSYAYSKIYK